MQEKDPEISEKEPEITDKKAREIPAPPLQEALDKVNRQDKTPANSDFPSGAFEEPDDDNAENIEDKTSENPENVTKEKEKPDTPLSVTYMIDSLFGFVGIYFFDGPQGLTLTPTELKFYENLEKRCGVEVFINSPYFFFGMLGICYSGKIVMLIRAKRKIKEIENSKYEAVKKEDRPNNSYIRATE